MKLAMLEVASALGGRNRIVLSVAIGRRPCPISLLLDAVPPLCGTRLSVFACPKRRDWGAQNDARRRGLQQ